MEEGLLNGKIALLVMNNFGQPLYYYNFKKRNFSLDDEHTTVTTGFASASCDFASKDLVVPGEFETLEESLSNYNNLKKKIDFLLNDKDILVKSVRDEYNKLKYINESLTTLLNRSNYKIADDDPFIKKLDYYSKQFLEINDYINKLKKVLPDKYKDRDKKPKRATIEIGNLKLKIVMGKKVYGVLKIKKESGLSNDFYEKLADVAEVIIKNIEEEYSKELEDLEKYGRLNNINRLDEFIENEVLKIKEQYKTTYNKAIIMEAISNIKIILGRNYKKYYKLINDAYESNDYDTIQKMNKELNKKVAKLTKFKKFKKALKHINTDFKEICHIFKIPQITSKSILLTQFKLSLKEVFPRD